jgi:imidazole glycerol-phosphate synthase subunit HisH
MIGIIDYKAGNITSVARALQNIGESYFISDDVAKLKEADRVIFPGVGAAGDAMSNLKSKDIDGWLREWIKEGKPLMGICLGTQIILDYSEENETKCVGIIKGSTKRFSENLSYQDSKLKIPHMGWNRVTFRRAHPVFADVAANAQFYFVHSYYPAPARDDVVLGITDYGISFCSVLASNNLIAMQFHPEKSGRPGLQVLKSFCKWRGNA